MNSLQFLTNLLIVCPTNLFYYFTPGQMHFPLGINEVDLSIYTIQEFDYVNLMGLIVLHPLPEKVWLSLDPI